MTQPLPSDHPVYLAAIERRWVRRARVAARVVLRTDPLPSAADAERFARSYFDGDVLADDLIRDLQGNGGYRRGRALLEQALRDGPDSVPDAPPSLKALLQQVTTEPDWLDREKAELGARVYRRLGVAALSIAVGGQMLGYTEPLGVLPVMLTGTYSRDLHGRLTDTVRYHLEASEPGALQLIWPASEGLAITLRVRILHAFLRSHVAVSERWRGAEWGVPISQFEMIGPMLGQSIGTTAAATLAGHWTTGREREALLHFWRYNGYLMGCDPDWFPTTVDEAIRVTSFYFLRRSYTAMDDCAAIARRIPDAFAPRAGQPLRSRIRDRLNQQSQIGWLAVAFGPSYRAFDMPSPIPGWIINSAPLPFNLLLTLTAWSGSRGAAAVDALQRRRRRRWYAAEARKQGPGRAGYAPRPGLFGRIRAGSTS